METKTMKREDDRSRLIVLLSIAQATAIVPVAPPPAELFSPGQSVLQWWASWFKECTELPKQYVEPSSQPICGLVAFLASEGRQ